MKRPSLIRNILSSSGGYLISILISFIVSPVTLHNLGDMKYGAWSIVSELVGYYGLLDLGIRGAVTYFVAQHTALSDKDDFSRTLASAFWALAGSGCLVMLGGIGMAVGFPYFFHSHGLNIREIRTVLIIMSALIAIGLPMNSFGAVLVGQRRIDLASGIEIGSRLLIGGFTYWQMRIGAGLLSLAMIQVVGRVLAWVVTYILASRLVGGIHLQIRWFSKERFRALGAYGFKNLIGQIALVIIYRVDVMVVGAFVGVQAVTYYTIGGTLVTYCSTAVSMISQNFTPHFTYVNSKKDYSELERLYLAGCRLSGLLAAGFAGGVIAFGSPFISLWLGKQYVTGNWQWRSDVIMMILLIAQLPRFMQSISWQLLYGTGRVRFLMWLNVLEAIANLALSLYFVRIYGPAGVALGTLLPLLVTHLLVLPTYMLKTFHIGLGRYLSQGVGRPIIVGLAMALLGVFQKRIAAPSTWRVLVPEVFITAAVGMVLGLLITFTTEDRGALKARLFPSIAAATSAGKE